LQPNSLHFYPGWTSDYPDFNLITADNYIFPISRAIFSVESPVFKAELSTNFANRDGQVRSQLTSDVLLEMSKFLHKQNCTANLRTVALELYRAAEYYQLPLDKLTNWIWSKKN